MHRVPFIGVPRAAIAQHRIVHGAPGMSLTRFFAFLGCYFLPNRRMGGACLSHLPLYFIDACHGVLGIRGGFACVTALFVVVAPDDRGDHRVDSNLGKR